MTGLPAATGRSSALITLARDTDAIITLLERFGHLLADALEAAGRGADEEFVVAVAERGRVTTALGNRLAALAIARQMARREGATPAQIAAALRPVDHALRHAQLLHDRIVDGAESVAPLLSAGSGPLTLVR